MSWLVPLHLGSVLSPSSPWGPLFPVASSLWENQGREALHQSGSHHYRSDFSVVVMKSSRACSRHQLSGPVDLRARMSAPRGPLEDLLTVVPPVICGAWGNAEGKYQGT